MLINLNTDISGTIKDTIKMNESRQQKLDEMKRNFNMTPEEREENEYNIYLKDLFSDVNFWSTEKLEIYNRLLDAGDMDLLKNIKNPYYDNNTGIRKAKVDFGYTDEEFEEIKRCKADLIYFAEHYCYTMTAEGHKQIKLRPYQKRVLRELYENRFSVFLASRQIGKCLNFDSVLNINGNDVYFFELYFNKLKQLRKLRVKERLKLFLYKIYTKI